MSSTSSRIIKNTGWLYAKMGITMFISLYTTRLILNGLGASDFGIYNIVGGAIAMLGFLNAAMASATQRFINHAEGEGNKNKVKTIFNISIILHFFIALIVGICLTLAGFAFFNGILVIPPERNNAAIVVYASLIVSTMFTVMTVPYDAVINANENMRYYAFIGIVEGFLKLSVAYYCVITTVDKLIMYGVLMACIPLITLSIMRFYCHRHYEECVISPRKYYSKSLMSEMTSFAGWNFLVSLTTMFTQYSIGILLNHFFGVLLNAALGIANQLSGMLQTLTLNAQKAINPVLMKSAGARNQEYFVYISITGSRLSFFIFGLFSIPCIFLMSDLLHLWLNSIPVYGIVFCQLQLIRILLEEPLISLRSAINAQGEIKDYCISRSIVFSMPLVIIPFIFDNGGGPCWLYVVWIFCWAILEGLVTMRFLKRNVDIEYGLVLKKVICPCIITVSVSALPYFITMCTECSFSTRIILSFIQIVLYLALSWKLLIFKQEQTAILLFIRKKLRFKRNG